MKKIWKIVILSVLILVLIAISYFLYNKWQESKMGFVSFEKVTEQKIDGKTYIENKEVGLKFAIPEGWEVGKYGEGVSIYSSDFVPLSKQSFFVPKNGCWFEVATEILKDNNDYNPEYGNLKLMIEDQAYLAERISDRDKLEIFNVSGLKGVKSSLLLDSNPNNVGNFIWVGVPKRNLMYLFSGYIIGQDKERCSQEFNNFLTTVNIKK